MKIYILLLSAVFSICSAQSPKGYAPSYEKKYAPPVAILKQIDRHNDDGSYSYGYENADGTYKIETKYPTGEVFGKYGYIDDVGKLREVEYGASRRGFEPAGNDITVAPPTLNNNPEAQRPLGPNEEDDGQYREDPADYYTNDPEFIPKPAYQSYQRSYETGYMPNYQAPAPIPAPLPAPTPAPPTYTQASYRPSYTPTYPQYNDYSRNSYQSTPNTYSPPRAPQYNYAPQQNYWNPSPPAYPGYNMFQGSPAQNVDIWTGSYSVNYRR